jgi:CheY-like chemotaxis protein
MALRVLVVEDNADAAESLGSVLRYWGYEVRIVHDGFAALSEMIHFSAHVVLADLGLPGMTGFELAERLADKDVLLIATTAYGDDAARRLAKNAGFREHFVKPLDLPAIHQVLEERAHAPGT